MHRKEPCAQAENVNNTNGKQSKGSQFPVISSVISFKKK
jgi:hypothetical protein